MAFGQQSGPPASSRQVQELLALLQGAGLGGFRDARGPMGFTQRQAGGRFTRDEAEGFIERLEGGESDLGQPVEVLGWRHSAQEQLLEPHARRTASRRASTSRLDGNRTPKAVARGGAGRRVARGRARWRGLRRGPGKALDAQRRPARDRVQLGPPAAPPGSDLLFTLHRRRIAAPGWVAQRPGGREDGNNGQV